MGRPELVIHLNWLSQTICTIPVPLLHAPAPGKSKPTDTVLDPEKLMEGSVCHSVAPSGLAQHQDPESRRKSRRSENPKYSHLKRFQIKMAAMRR
jgi:hypothetical protein